MNGLIGGIILSSGRSSRMLGVDKGTVSLAGEPLLERVIGRFLPQVDCLAINTAAEYAAEYGLPLIADKIPGFHGPLMGVWSAFEHPSLQKVDRLAVVPCDGPFLPADLVIKLNDRMDDEDADVVVVSYEDQWQPTFSLWHRRAAGQIRTTIQQGRNIGLRAMIRELKSAMLEWPLQEPPPFFNINSPHDLSAAEKLL